MNEPKFVPGERVILESKRRTELNGEHTIESVQFFDRMRKIDTDGPISSGFLYVLVGVDMRGDGWIESALRKLPPETPATFDASIWAPNKETVK